MRSPLVAGQRAWCPADARCSQALARLWPLTLPHIGSAGLSSDKSVQGLLDCLTCIT